MSREERQLPWMNLICMALGHTGLDPADSDVCKLSSLRVTDTPGSNGHKIRVPFAILSSTMAESS